MGTQAGMSRFDGAEFKNFTAEDGLSEGGVRAICQDAFGNIWMGHDGGGISRFDGNKFEILQNTAIHFKSNITTILEDSDGNIWIASQLRMDPYIL
jgi:ligand-binding sensor domain-containing protein